MPRKISHFTHRTLHFKVVENMTLRKNSPKSEDDVKMEIPVLVQLLKAKLLVLNQFPGR